MDREPYTVTHLDTAIELAAMFGSGGLNNIACHAIFHLFLDLQ